ncbi:TPA: hypothetical protein VAZ98_000560 [Streptococcus agalactiae]|uniref:hypothetical protein n=1 Tax=Streptococcus dysgalactiae TaxID=1334 RepID=UPI002AF8D849|nr:hypothetical protein [Streptococcus agalactiae]HEP7759335.1 hypothetical protein [Streptococcus pyogenes]HEP7761036.1 hypothetical protein [Streptococcus pyogenes]HES7144966.1 hypothetical protein [Streptococcus pyogenes]HES7146406.1 hypothetical protein [Streptococcus pyogenes]
MVIHDINQNKREVILLIHPMNFSGKMMMDSMAKDVGRILRTFKIKKNVEVTDNGKIII